MHQKMLHQMIWHSKMGALYISMGFSPFMLNKALQAPLDASPLTAAIQVVRDMTEDSFKEGMVKFFKPEDPNQFGGTICVLYIIICSMTHIPRRFLLFALEVKTCLEYASYCRTYNTTYCNLCNA